MTVREQQDLDANLFRLLVDRVLDYAIFLLTPDGHIASWNAGAQRVKGYTADEIIGQSFEVFYTPEDRAAGRPHLLLGKARAEGRVEDEAYRVRKNGTRFWADVVITALRDESGELVGFAKVTRDLTERRAAEQERTRRLAAERAAERFARLQRASAAMSAASRQHEVAAILAESAVAAIGRCGAVVGFASSADGSMEIAARHGDLAHSVTLGHLTAVCQTGEPVFPDDRHAEAIVPLRVEHRLLGALALSIDPPRSLDTDERAYLQALADVGAGAVERARLFESEQHARTEAETAVKAQDEFLSIASHELRTPVAAVKATAQLAQRAISRDEPEISRLERYFETIARASDRLNTLVEDLLDVSRLRTGQLQLRQTTVDLVGLVQDVVTRYAQSPGPHAFHFRPPETPVVVEADPVRIEQVLDNLLSNAVKYSPAGGDITVALQPDTEGVTVTVSDRGIGLPAGQERRIFETFGRASNANLQQIPGLGLGLAICRQLVERHGGRIWATSPGEDQGTTFAFWLPVNGRG